MKVIKTTLLLFLVLLSCSKEEPSVIVNTSPTITKPQWLVPQDEVFDGGPGIDGIPSIDNPKFDKVEDVNSAFDDELVIGIIHDDIIHGYPVPILDWHEIVNDEVGDLNIAITYCPLTGTAIGWNRKIGSTVTTFGVSGLLYNSNLMPYDRRTNSIWSQQRLECVNGTRIGTLPESFSLIETTLSTWRKCFPDSDIMNANTGFDRRYSIYPYSNYRTNEDLLFPVSNQDDQLSLKERVLGVIINARSMAFRFNESGEGIEVIHSELDGTSFIVIRSEDDNFNTAFLNSNNRSYEAVQNSLPIIMKDQLGNKYDLAGRIISGPSTGQALEKPISFIGYWFSWPAFYPDIELYN